MSETDENLSTCIDATMKDNSDCPISTHESNSPKASLRDLGEELKIQRIAASFREIMEVLGLDLTNDSLKRTPSRVAKMFVKELFTGLNPGNRPTMTLFENKFDYAEMLVERDISFYSVCEHHFLPIMGKAHVAYIPNHHVIGLSKISRIVQFVSRRPQIQEKLTVEIRDELKAALATEDVGVVVEAHHLCVAMRGVKGNDSRTLSASFSGRFRNKSTQDTFLSMLPNHEPSLVMGILASSVSCGVDYNGV